METSRPLRSGRQICRGRDWYVALSLGQDKAGRHRLVFAQRPTADFFGWTAALPLWQGHRRQTPSGAWVGLQMGAVRRGPNKGGKRVYISRSPSKMGHPAGLTHCFRINSLVRLQDMARLAAVTVGEWTWMETRFGERKSRDCWLSMANALPDRGGAADVPFIAREAC